MKKLSTKGYTLVEMILYCAIATLLLGAIVNVSVLLSRSYREMKEIKNIQMSGLSVVDQFVRIVRASESIDGSGTVYNSASGAVLLRSTDSSSNPHTTRIYLSSGRILLDKDGVYLGPLTDNSVVVTSFILRPISTGNSLGVKMELTIDGTSFYHTAMLRDSYN